MSMIGGIHMGLRMGTLWSTACGKSNVQQDSNPTLTTCGALLSGDYITVTPAFPDYGTQKVQYPSIRECTSNHIRGPSII